MTTTFVYKAGVLHAEDVSLARVAEAVGTPFYCYSSRAVACAYEAFAGAFADRPSLVCYALKANANLALVRTLARLGAGADVVSEGELRVALAAGVPAERIVFAGVGKTEAEMAAGLEAGILQFNVESLPELEALNRIATARGLRAPTALRINPDVDARTHEKITTGRAENKFGIDLGRAREIAASAAEMPGIALQGLAVHIGSQLTGLAPFRAAFERMAALYGELRAAGHDLTQMDFGGGLGIAYRDEAPPAVADYAAMVKQVVGDLDARLVFEPGRLLVGNAGVLVTRVIYVKEGAQRRFLILDSAMNDLIRPTLYEAWHDIVAVSEASGTETQAFDIVGPVCETGDTFARQRPLPPMAAGDLLAICCTGAYSACMASEYNMRRLAPEVMVRGQEFAVVRARGDYAAMLARDRLPGWLEAEDGASPETVGGAA
ncbi:MAG: diaminopimelate decarboxylase [Kiloniellales bacterium]|nr:diaminopimelate decarboxylase [Kiloniellales bacterium]